MECADARKIGRTAGRKRGMQESLHLILYFPWIVYFSRCTSGLKSCSGWPREKSQGKPGKLVNGPPSPPIATPGRCLSGRSLRQPSFATTCENNDSRLFRLYQLRSMTFPAWD